ncbi:MAG: hypothetical protein HY678_11295, partial [Chloroflexi bacterium]|nr:hypothetical protein [Chloroflexota bacterium]
WRYERQQDLAAALMHSVLREAGKQEGMAVKARGVAKRLWRLAPRVLLAAGTAGLGATVPVAGQVVAAVTAAAQEDDSDYQSEVDRLLSDFDGVLAAWSNGAPVVVFVDDLDRCLPDQVVNLAVGIRIFLDESKCRFVIGVDRSTLEAAIESRYGVNYREVGRTYIDKIIQLPVPLPPVNRKGLQKRYGKRLEELGLTGKAQAPVALGLVNNPRSYERFINTFAVISALASSQKLIASEPDRGALALFVVLGQRFYDFFEATVGSPKLHLIPFVEHCRVGEVWNDKAWVDSGIGHLRPYFDNAELKDFFKRLSDGWGWGDSKNAYNAVGTLGDRLEPLAALVAATSSG